MVAGRGTPGFLELGTILGKVELAQDKKDRYSAEVGGRTRTAAQEDRSDRPSCDGRCKEGQRGREGGGEVEAGTNCRAKKVMKIAAQAGRGPGVQIQKRLYQMKHLTKDRPRVVFRSAGDHSRGRRERKRGRRKRWQGGWTLDGYADRGHIQIQRCLNLIPYASDIQPTYGRPDE